MKLKLHDAIGSMDYDDLVELNRDLQQGGISIKRLVEEKIINKEKEMGKHCVACNSEIDPSRTSNYTLLFGPEGLRRKATFCALDCLKYFITDLERRRAEYQQKAMKKDED
jgi:hypothetical protein